ncbi:hypothetical protein GOP47_0001681 [Adiantum capillus-veneris]|uniref:STAS domain-containing protein n=1 Tax=Adiantum capillus-veneris TaxID=13818 RepID=A0A9D4ZNA8_ADICA|nr:hypothetical protein GOP47_0001681 [Adiantum capillus-veneris]
MRVSQIHSVSDFHGTLGMDKAQSSSVRVKRVLPLQRPTDEGVEQSKESLKKWRLSWPSSWIEWLQIFIPCVRWLRTYDFRSYLKTDLMAGITVGTMLVPQAMSYAALAGLESIYGLYAGLVPVFAYAIFGSSRQLAVGPVALVSLLVSNVLAKVVDLQEDQSDEAVQYYSDLAILLALMVGVIECLMGILRLGWLIRFISHTVISGFTSASAIVIALSQTKYFLGYSVTRSSKIIPLFESIFSGIGEFKWRPFALGCVMLGILLTMKHLGKTRKKLRLVRAAGPLTAVIIGTLFAWVFSPADITLVGAIPQGLPQFLVPKHFDKVPDLIGTAFLISGVAILESVGIAKALAAKHGYEIDSNQELFGLGVANVCGSFFSAYPTTGSFSRSAVNNESGAKTGLAGIITGAVMAAALIFLTPVFAHVPQCTLAAIVVSAVLGLIDYEEPMFLWDVDKRDFLLWMASFVFTLFLGIEIGVLIAVGLSLAFVIYESANPHVAILGRLPGTTVYRNIQQYPEAYTYQGIVIVRIDAPMYFANISFIKERLRKYELQSEGNEQSSKQVQYIILELAPVTHIDSSAVLALKELYEEFKARNIQMALSNPNHQVMVTLGKSHIPEIMGKEWYFVRVHDAVQVCLLHMQRRQPDAEGQDQYYDYLSQNSKGRMLTDSEAAPLLTRKGDV